MFFVKGLSDVEDAPPKRKRWMVEIDEFTSFKFFPKSYEELQAWLRDISSEYSTPMPVPCLNKGYDWRSEKYTVLLFMTMRRLDGTWFHAVLSKAHLFIMNNTGETVDRITV